MSHAGAVELHLALLHAVHVHRRRRAADPAPPAPVTAAALLVAVVQVQYLVHVAVDPFPDEALLGKLK